MTPTEKRKRSARRAQAKLDAVARKWMLVETPDGDVRPPESFREWLAQQEDPRSRRVAHTQVGELEVSTVFLGFTGAERALGFPFLPYETMIFGPKGHPWNLWQRRYATRAEALRAHTAVVAEVELGLLRRKIDDGDA